MSDSLLLTCSMVPFRLLNLQNALSNPELGSSMSQTLKMPPHLSHIDESGQEPHVALYYSAGAIPRLVVG